ncbi:hypothetical protein [Cohnella thailandensis]|uniref:Uncharacterized protein n=1 Tax=Cohnella thailandensis TaxID=557557 RepID=A0A841SZY4_9BACL|nr:hypothetical protein [Cohnella thailandensis]MBB6636842.1 hypothetical protein [Cohnella thailandensis]MBP1973281.1 hypothetical protein [Cohnella thailandensis]
MIQSMKASVVEDTSSDEYDYWDSIPPYGVVEVYEVELIDRAGSEESEIEALFRLVNSYLMNTFLMFTYRSSEITKIEKYIQEDIQFARMYTHEGESCYRLKMLGW